MSKRIACRLLIVIAAAGSAPAAAQETIRLPAKDIALKDRPADVYTVGTVEGEDWEMFSGIRSIVFDRSDNMYLLDGQNSRVVVFDAKGKFVRQFGSTGGGPGEFQAPFAMDITSDGNIVVSDLGNRAFIVFTPAGEHVRNVPFDDRLGFPLGLAADERGGVIVRSGPRVRRDAEATDSEDFSPIYRQSLAESDGTEARTLYRVPVHRPQLVESGSAAGRRVAFRSMNPVFGPRATFGALPSGFALHHESDYAVRIIDPAGRHVRTITRDYKLRKVTKKDQEEWHERRIELEASGGPVVVTARVGTGGSPSVSIGGAGASGAPLRASLENAPFAEFMSVVTSIRTDPQGRIWVQRRRSDATAEGAIDLVMSDGRYIGTLPPQPLPRAVSPSGLAAWVETDDLGVERVAVRRLPAAWR